MHRTLAHGLFTALLIALPAFASAQQGGPDLRIGAGMVVDFGGEVDNDGPGDDDLEATIGLRAHLDVDVHDYVSVGGFTRFSWWEGDDSWQERNFLFDIGPRVNGHYDWRDFRFYVAAMPGLLISRLDDDFVALDNPAAGFTMSITPGMEYWFSRRFGVFVEIFGWVGHYFSHDVDVGTGDVDFELNQVLFEFGALVAP